MFKQLFDPIDKLGYTSFLILWFSCFSVSFVTLLVDSTTGPVRDFTAVSQLVCCTNLVSLGYGLTHNVKWSKASLLTVNMDLFISWTAFAYFGGGATLSSSPIGIWNYIQVVMFSVMSLANIVSLFAVALNQVGYRKYLEDSSGSPSAEVQDTSDNTL
tara:strand:+ start:107 stop:580 length:474 start_codon:yes stop_codon:yes gene_type:complete